MERVQREGDRCDGDHGRVHLAEDASRRVGHVPYVLQMVNVSPCLLLMLDGDLRPVDPEV